MATDQQPTTPGSTPRTPAGGGRSNPSAANTTRVIIILVIAALAAVAGYFAFRTSELSRQNTDLAENQVELETEIRQLNDRVTQMGSDIENRDIQLEEKTRALESVNSDLEAARKRINQLVAAGRLSARQVEEYQYKVDQMQYYMEKYQGQIAELQRENERLTGEVTNLNQEVKRRDSTLTDVQREKTLLQTKVQAASILKANEWQFYEVNRRGKESEARDRELRLRSDDRLKVCFSVNENAVAEVGSRTIYASIKAPDGSVYKALDGGSGYFTTATAQETAYSSKASINYDRSAQRVCVDYKPEGEFQRGPHRITVYADGYEIGNSTFTVK